MLSDATLVKLDQQLLVMRIIHAALTTGVLAFAAVSLVLANGELKGAAQPIDWIMAAFGASTAVLGWIVPRLIPPPTSASAGTDETSVAMSILSGIQTAMIIGCAIFEGGAFANLSRYFTDHIALNLAVAGVLAFFLLLQFPRRGAILEQIESRLRQLREEKQMTGTAR